MYLVVYRFFLETFFRKRGTLALVQEYTLCAKLSHEDLNIPSYTVPHMHGSLRWISVICGGGNPINY